MMGTGPVFDGMGMINAIYSYGSDIAIAFTADRDMVPDPAVYAAALQEAFDELLIADMSAPAPKAKAEKKAASPKPAAKAKTPPAKKAKPKKVTTKAATKAAKP
jgi:hypothetical protein